MGADFEDGEGNPRVGGKKGEIFGIKTGGRERGIRGG